MYMYVQGTCLCNVIKAVFTVRSCQHLAKPQAGGLPLVNCLQMLIRYIHGYPPYWRKLRNKELNDFYFSPSIVRLIKSRRMIWAGHVAWIGESRGVYRVLVGKPEGDPGVDGRIILRWVFRKWAIRAWIGSMWLRIGTGSGHL